RRHSRRHKPAPECSWISPADTVCFLPFGEVLVGVEADDLTARLSGMRRSGDADEVLRPTYPLLCREFCFGMQMAPPGGRNLRCRNHRGTLAHRGGRRSPYRIPGFEETPRPLRNDPAPRTVQLPGLGIDGLGQLTGES